MADAAGPGGRAAGDRWRVRPALRPLLAETGDFAAAVERHLNRPGSRLFAIRALIVESDPYNLRLLHDLLQVLGHAVIEAKYADEAVALARRHAPDVVLVAVGPQDGSALDLRRRLEAEAGLAGVPVIALVDAIHGVAEDEPRATAFDGAVPKPIPLTLFLEVLETLLAERATQS